MQGYIFILSQIGYPQTDDELNYVYVLERQVLDRGGGS